ncbi:MAG: hypothetical protein A2Z70_01830 [Chloroflexi bacterium RBG_13_48_17]|nr:MAG: hypothetical protein A2Z70_01830 [Chloroflexi bacterium RBG_13_48_17]
MRNNPTKKQKSGDKRFWYRNPAIIVPVIVAIIGAVGVVLAAGLGSRDNGPQLSTITGVVTDANGVPIEAAIVEIEGLSATTDMSGVYVIRDVKAGMRIITLRAPGLEAIMRPVTIAKGGEIVIFPIQLPSVVVAPVSAPTQLKAEPEPEPEPELKPDIRVAAILPQGYSIPFGDQFNVIVTVYNYGSGPAQNLHLYARANPSGYFAIIDCDRPYSPLVPSGFDISLGDLYPDDNAQINIILRAPTRDQVGQQGMNAELSFTYDYYNAGSETYAANIPFSVNQVIMFWNPK